MESIDVFDVARLSMLVAVVECGSFRDAADDQGVAASTVQKNMRLLEQALDLSLFEKRGRNIVPTAAAHELVTAAEPLLREAQALCNKVDRIRTRDERSIRIACAPIHLAQFLAGAIRLFEEQNQGYEAQVELFDPAEMPDAASFDRVLAQNEADFVATIHELPGRSSVVMWTTKVVVVTADDHPLRGRSRISVQDLNGESVCAQPSHVWSRKALDRLIGGADVKINVVTEAIPDVAVGLALTGFGVAVVADDCLPSLGEYPELVDGRRPIVGNVKLHSKAELDPAGELFLKAVRDHTPLHAVVGGRPGG